MRTPLLVTLVLVSPAVYAQNGGAPEPNPKQFASATCAPGKSPRVLSTATVRCGFKSGSANLSDDPNCVAQLEPVLKDLMNFKDASVLVQGFADARGKADANKSLSIQRASAVRKYLIDGGLQGERFTVDGFGSDSEFMLCKENKDDCHAQNRRIEIVKYLCKKAK
jgi:outer membrane protein OmpA-like peptidoglycan-associated protein